MQEGIVETDGVSGQNLPEPQLVKKRPKEEKPS